MASLALFDSPPPWYQTCLGCSNSLVTIVFALPGWVGAYCGRRWLALGQAEGRGIYHLYLCMHGCMYVQYAARTEQGRHVGTVTN